MVVRLHPGQERKLSGAEDKDEDAEEEGEKEDDIIDDGKELEIEIARSEEEEEVGLAEEAEIENVSDDETVGIETMGDSQPVVGIEDDPEEDSLEENPDTEGILEDTDGGLEDTAEKAEDGKEELIESESDEESREDLTGECFYFLGLFVFCLFVGVVVWKLENGEDLSGFACRPVYLHSSRNAYAPPICNASVHKNQPVVLWRWIFLRLPFKCSINILVAGQNNYRQGGNSPNLDG